MSLTDITEELKDQLANKDEEIEAHIQENVKKKSLNFELNYFRKISKRGARS